MKPIRRSPMPRFLASILLCATMVAAASGSSPASPSGMASALEGRIVSGEGVTLPDAEREIARAAGTVDLAAGDWPDAFLVRAGEKVCVAVSPFTGCYEFFDESGSVFWTVVPVLPTTDNWVAPFRHAEPGPSPDDDLYAPWRLVDVWMLSHAESAEFESHAESAEIAEAQSPPPAAAAPLECRVYDVPPALLAALARPPSYKVTVVCVPSPHAGNAATAWVEATSDGTTWRRLAPVTPASLVKTIVFSNPIRDVRVVSDAPGPPAYDIREVVLAN